MRTYDRIQAAFPSEGSMEMVVVKADEVTSPTVISAIDSLETKAHQRPGLFEGHATVDVSTDQTVPSWLSRPRGRAPTTSNRAVDALRDDLVPATSARSTASRPTRPVRPPRQATSTTR